jgi:hypothetical protein
MKNPNGPDALRDKERKLPLNYNYERVLRAVLKARDICDAIKSRDGETLEQFSQRRHEMAAEIITEELFTCTSGHWYDRQWCPICDNDE